MTNVNLAEARQNLPEFTDRAYAGQTFTIARRGRPLAVLMGINEYLRLREIEREQSERDWEVLLNPPVVSDLSDEEAIELAVQVTREVRAQRFAAKKKQQSG